ncbi:hypothetical protein B0H19DRAFT_1247665 [Mycena capillaripes]|nr:hypothetical protein B0H19DRAFT_1247665 [Mycena capillaripes]
MAFGRHFPLSRFRHNASPAPLHESDTSAVTPTLFCPAQAQQIYLQPRSHRRPCASSPRPQLTQQWRRSHTSIRLSCPCCVAHRSSFALQHSLRYASRPAAAPVVSVDHPAPEHRAPPYPLHTVPDVLHARDVVPNTLYRPRRSASHAQHHAGSHLHPIPRHWPLTLLLRRVSAHLDSLPPIPPRRPQPTPTVHRESRHAPPNACSARTLSLVIDTCMPRRTSSWVKGPSSRLHAPSALCPRAHHRIIRILSRSPSHRPRLHPHPLAISARALRCAMRQRVEIFRAVYFLLGCVRRRSGETASGARTASLLHSSRSAPSDGIPASGTPVSRCVLPPSAYARDGGESTPAFREAMYSWHVAPGVGMGASRASRVAFYALLHTAAPRARRPSSLWRTFRASRPVFADLPSLSRLSFITRRVIAFTHKSHPSAVFVVCASVPRRASLAPQHPSSLLDPPTHGVPSLFVSAPPGPPSLSLPLPTPRKPNRLSLRCPHRSSVESDLSRVPALQVPAGPRPSGVPDSLGLVLCPSPSRRARLIMDGNLARYHHRTPKGRNNLTALHGVRRARAYALRGLHGLAVKRTHPSRLRVVYICPCVPPLSLTWLHGRANHTAAAESRPRRPAPHYPSTVSGRSRRAAPCISPSAISRERPVRACGVLS